MNVEIKALKNKFKPSLLTRNGKQFPDYKVAIVENMDTIEQCGYRITKGEKFESVNIGDVLTNFKFQTNDKSGKIRISTSSYDSDIFGMPLVMPVSFQTSELIKK